MRLSIAILASVLIATPAWAGQSKTATATVATTGHPASEGTVAATAIDCPLALVLAIDGSSSVDAQEHKMQTLGIAAALSDPQVKDAILTGGGIWISSFEWSGRNQHVIQVDWTYLGSERAIDVVAAQLATAPRGHTEFPTSLGHALGFAAIQMRKLQQPCHRKVIDIAGDGVNNDGFPPASAYRAQDFSDMTVNGLVIKGEEPDPEPFYREEVVRGAGAFVEIANGYDDYAIAMKRKLLREIMGAALADAG